MREIPGKHLLCLFLLFFPLSWTENDVRKTSEVAMRSQPMTRRLRKISPPKESHLQKKKSNLAPRARHCGRPMASCSSQLPCCDPCAFCRCRLFRTVCYCWRLNSECPRKT
ncbi:agouti-signaling protein 2b [Brachionichthys hirsutus]|uniref:agouti-signaling protein 2b n=1 Tax=Brachionichthys hirsutus TaxID=412623 RepID=UPI003604B69C